MLKSLKILSVCSLLMLSYTARAQQAYQNLEDKIEIDPTQVYPQAVVNKAWKQRITFKNGRDTLYIERFDGEGRKTYQKGFEDGKPESITTYINSKDGKTWSWRSLRLKNKTVWTSKTTYRSPGVPLRFDNMDYRANGDTVGSQGAQFRYDAAGKLLQRRDFSVGRMSIQRNYQYKGNLLIEMSSQLAGSVAKKRMAYRYDGDGNLIESKEYFINPQETTLMKTTLYGWKNGKVVNKTYREEISKKRNYQFSYSYDAKGRMATYEAKLDSNFKQAAFIYEGDRLKEITVRFNSSEFFPDALPLWRAGAVAGTRVYRKVFSYNEKGDLVKVQDFYDNRLENSFHYELTY